MTNETPPTSQNAGMRSNQIVVRDMPPLTPFTSETARYPGFRELVQPYCEGYGLDIGFGGDPINETAIRMDLPQPYVNTGAATVQLGGDCRDLRWFRDDVLDFVYSSHVLEDFDEHETGLILREWTRVLRVNGTLSLLLPDQPRYLAYCRSRGERDNDHHSIARFSLDYVKGVAQTLGNLEVALERPEIGPYSFLLVLRKTAAATTAGAEIQSLRDEMQLVWAERDDLRVRWRGHEQEVSDIREQGRREAEELQAVKAHLAILRRHPIARFGRLLRRLRSKILP